MARENHPIWPPAPPPSSPKRDRERMEVIACCRIIRLNVSSLSRKIAIGQDFPSITLCNRRDAVDDVVVADVDENESYAVELVAGVGKGPACQML